MRKTRKKKDINTLNEAVYDFFDYYEKDGELTDKIVSYYLDKIKKHGRDSLTQKEMEIFTDANKGKTPLDQPVYQKNKVTGDIDYDDKGRPIRIDKEVIVPGIPFITSKGKGGRKHETVNGRIYSNVGEEHRMYYVFGERGENSNGLIAWRTVAKDPNEKKFGSFIVPKAESTMSVDEVWKTMDNKYDKAIKLDRDIYLKFLEFDNIYHTSKKDGYNRMVELYNELKNYGLKK